MNRNINLLENLLRRKERLAALAKRKTIKRRKQKKFAKKTKQAQRRMK